MSEQSETGTTGHQSVETTLEHYGATMSKGNEDRQGKPLVDLPIEVEEVRKGATVHPGGYISEITRDHRILHCGNITATEHGEGE